MAHSKSAQKRIRIAERNRLRNKAVRSRVKTMIKKFEDTLESKDLEACKSALNLAYSELDRATKKGVIHRNASSRKKSRLTLKMNKIFAS